jgi:hypothetical protein
LYLAESKTLKSIDINDSNRRKLGIVAANYLGLSGRAIPEYAHPQIPCPYFQKSNPPFLNTLFTLKPST